MRKASIDLGTNTCLLLAGEWSPGRGVLVEVLADEIAYVRLGQGVDSTRELQPEAMARALGSLTRYKEQLGHLGISPEEVVAVATSQARDAKNGSAFFERIRKELGFQFRTLSGDEEARLTFLGGLLPATPAHSSAVIDIGGGSTELVTLQGGRSLDIGSVRFTERFFKKIPVDDLSFWACQEELDREIRTMESWRAQLAKGTALVGVAGTVTTIAAWNLGLGQYNPRALDGHVLHRGDVHRLVEELKWRNLDERKMLPGLDEKRADVILAGAMILWRVMELLHFETVAVSTRGLRYGVMQL